MEIEGNRLYTVKQVAEILTRSPESVRRLIRKGELPARNIGRRLYVLGSDLLAAGDQVQAEQVQGRDQAEQEKAAPADRGQVKGKGKVRVRENPPAVQAAGRIIPRVIGDL